MELFLIIVCFIGYKIYDSYMGNQFAKMDKTHLSHAKMAEDSLKGYIQKQIERNCVRGKYNKR